MIVYQCSSSAIWVTGSDAGSVAFRARGELTRSKCEWTRIWTTYLECRWNNPMYLMLKLVYLNVWMWCQESSGGNVAHRALSFTFTILNE
jgi:hypothetical protein